MSGSRSRSIALARGQLAAGAMPLDRLLPAARARRARCARGARRRAPPCRASALEVSDRARPASSAPPSGLSVPRLPAAARIAGSQCVGHTRPSSDIRRADLVGAPRRSPGRPTRSRRSPGSGSPSPQMRSVAPNPSRWGISMSISTTSGTSVVQSATASSPSSATPTTSELRVAGEQSFDRLREQRMVVRDQHPHGPHVGTTPGVPARLRAAGEDGPDAGGHSDANAARRSRATAEPSPAHEPPA